VNKLIASTLISIGLTAASVSLAAAQTVTPPATSGAQAQHGPRHQHAKQPFGLPSERVEARLAYLKTALKITDAQQPQWNAFADVARKLAGERDQQVQARRAQMAQGAGHEKPTAIARMERQQQRHAAAAARLNALLAVERPLYAALTADQKAIADELLAPRGRHGGFRHHGKHSAA
jgi:hypothetical protein